ncbi:unnamed protein product [Danaus chrysippus]|uniref:(African queen) hypothetical protein n=1 Tax=Danaus chrysippus TaxID=151541 RepID=A0A8J2QVP8_9NEOP|nr:unnamed protein product [Danaus chrysippus]
MDSEPAEEKNETRDPGSPRGLTDENTQGRPMGDGTANVFLTSALTPGQLANKRPFTRQSTLHIGDRVDIGKAGMTAIVLEMTYGIQITSISPVSPLNKADCRSQTALRLLNLKRFPRTRPSWRTSEEAAVQTARYRHAPPPAPPLRSPPPPRSPYAFDPMERGMMRWNRRKGRLGRNDLYTVRKLRRCVGQAAARSHYTTQIIKKRNGNKCWNKILLISPGAANRAAATEGAKSPFLFYCMNANPAGKRRGERGCGHALGISTLPAPSHPRTLRTPHPSPALDPRAARCHRVRYPQKIRERPSTVDSRLRVARIVF